MPLHPFNQTILALSLSFLFPCVYASDIVNPQAIIGLTDDIAAQYSGKKVKIGVLDGGYQVEHVLVNRDKLHPIIFELTNSDGEKESFNPNVYNIETDKDEQGKEKRSYSVHGGQVAGVIGAKALASYQYAGGVAKDAELYLATFEADNPATQSLSASQANDDEEMEEEPTESKENQSLLSSNQPSLQFQRLALATGMNKLVAKRVFAINNSWNEDPVGHTVQEMDDAYRETILQAKNNPLLDAIENAVKQDTLLVFAAGNEEKKQAGIFAVLPRYLPQLESHYLSVIAVDDKHELESSYSNHCGASKNWCVAAPGSLAVLNTAGAETGEKIAGFVHAGGTSFAAPVVTGSLALLKERFPDFTTTQIRDTLLTTAKDLGQSGIDDTFGWGVIDMSSAIKGPRQLLKDEVYVLSRDDVWSNDLTAPYSLSKKGAATLTLNGQNRLHGINVQEGKLVLNGQTSVNTVMNQAHLAVADLNLTQSLIASPNSTLELVGKQGINAQGQTAVVQLAGKLAVNESLQQRAQAGDTIAQVVKLTHGASYQGGFDELAPSATLANQGLRQDVFFKDQSIEVVAHMNQPIQDASATINGQYGLQALNQLRDSHFALKKGLYNDWLQQALAGRHAQGLHYHIGNGIYADSIDNIRRQSALGLHRLNQRSSVYRDLSVAKNQMWLEQGKQQYASKGVNHHEATDFSSWHTEWGAAHQFSPQWTVASAVSHTQSKVNKPQSHSRTQQTSVGLAAHYMPQTTGWFSHAALQAAQVNYRQNRFFNTTHLGSANNRGRLWGMAMGAGYRFTPQGWQFEPHLGLQAIHLKMKALDERGEWGITTPAIKQTDWNLASGIRVKKAFQVNGWTIIPDLEMNYLHRLNQGKTQLHGTMAGVALTNESSTYGKRQFDIGAHLTLSKKKWFASAGIQHQLLNQGKGKRWQMKLGMQF